MVTPDDGTPLPNSRTIWEQRWGITTDEEFSWSLPGVAPQLVDLVESGSLPSGRALDLGCGAGASTEFLASWFTPSVGLDFAVGAVRQATDLRGDRGASFLAADATVLPFASDSFVFAFDRGCLQNVPKERWAAYFGEVGRVLRTGAVLQLLVSRRASPLTILSISGLRSRWKWYARRIRGGGPTVAKDEFVREMAEPSFDIEAMEDFPFVLKNGATRLFTHAQLRKR